MKEPTNLRCPDAATAMQLASLISTEHPECFATYYTSVTTRAPHVITDAPVRTVRSLARLIGMEA